MHTCSYCHVTHDGSPEATFAHNALPWHHLRVLADCGAPPHILRPWAIACEDAVNNVADQFTPEQYEAAFNALPHISGEVKIGEPV
jgi:hypothetical protein